MEDGVYIWGERLMPVNVIVHMVLGLLLLGAFTHHLWLLFKGQIRERAKAVGRFAYWGVLSYIACFVWGCFVYPTYKYYVRWLVQDEVAPWATCLFEIKEHTLAAGLAILPFYYLTSRAIKQMDKTTERLHNLSVVVLNVIIWFAFIVGAILVDLRGEF